MTEMPIASSMPLTKDLAVAYLAAAPDSFIVTDESGCIVMVNRQTEVLFGYSKDELLGQPIERLVPDSHSDAHASLRDKYFEAPASRTMGDPSSRVFALHKSGKLLPAEVALSPIEFEGHSGVIAIVRDTSDRAETETRLRASELAFRTAFRDAPVAMAITEVDEAGAGKIIEANQALTDLIGWEEAELRSRQLQELESADLSELSDGDDRRFQHRDGNYIWGSVRTSQIGALDDGVRSLSHIVDVTRRVEAERQRDRRERLLTALAEIRKKTLYETSLDDVLDMILRLTCDLVDAPHTFIAIPDAQGGLTYRAMCSELTADQSGKNLDRTKAIVDVIRRGQSVVISDEASSGELDFGGVKGLSSCIVVPLLASDNAEGALVAGRPLGQTHFNSEELATATSLGAEASLTFELARARADRRRIFLVEDRERIARDLHDVVIQRLFAAGMSLNASLADPDRLIDRATTVVDELDETIDVIRETIFKLTETDVTLTSEIVRIVDRYRTLGRNDVALDFNGDLGSVTADVAAHLLPTLNELLSNVDRHANARSAQVVIDASDVLALTVSDDGAGIDHDKPHGFGIRNVRNRAEHLGGAVTISKRDDGTGTTVVWSVPFSR